MVSVVSAYLDHAATTAMRPAAREAFLEASGVLGNPGAVHAAGRRARAVLDDALASIAEDLGVPRSWVILTSGGTEADNLALRGAAAAAARRDPERRSVAVCASDHAAVVETARALGPEIEGREIAVRADGQLDLDGLERALAPGDVSLVSAALVNNETGAVQDLAAISQRARAHGTLVHTDAVQGIGHTALPRWEDLDLMSLTAHKIGGPVGIGALIVRPDVELVPMTTGGGQQRSVRPGTLDAAHAAAFAAALHETLATWEAEMARLRGLAARLRTGILTADPSARFTLPEGAPQAGHIVHVLFPGADSESLLFLLDERGVCASAGSACHAGVMRISHVLEAMGIEEELARGSLRLSLGWTSTEEDVDAVLAALPEALTRSRAVGALRL